LNNTVAGGAPDYYDQHIMPGFPPAHAMDDSLTTKYYNTGARGNSNTQEEGPGIGTGFIVIPTVSNSTVACGLHFATAEDVPDRDPITVTLEGSNATTKEEFDIGSNWKLLYNGPTGINATHEPDREKYVTQQNFTNELRFASYRLLITSKRASSTAVQYSEARIMGYV
jgi:hypothetical protein